jgi:hypothetical protein
MVGEEDAQRVLHQLQVLGSGLLLGLLEHGGEPRLSRLRIGQFHEARRHGERVLEVSRQEGNEARRR